MNELGANLGEQILGNERFIERIVQKDASLAQRILAKIRDLLQAFRTLGNKEARTEYKRLKAAEKLYMEAMEKAGVSRIFERASEISAKSEDSLASDNISEEIDNEKGETDNETNAYSNNVQFSLKPFAKQVDEVLNGADTSSTHLKVMDTPKLLQEAGLPNLPILLTANHLKSISGVKNSGKGNFHNLSTNLVKKIPSYIANPVLIADSFTDDKSIVIVTEAIDSQNRPVIAAIRLDGRGQYENRYIKANILTSAYGKDNCQSFLNRIGLENATIYWNKEKSQALSVNLGIQFPNVITSLDSNTIIRKAKAFVKISSQKKSGNSQFSLKPADEELMRETDEDSSEADTQKIAPGMSDEERYEALKDRTISLSAVADNEKLEVAKAKLNFSESDLEFSKYTDKVKLFKKIGEEFSIFHDYENQDINVIFSFSKGKMQESVNKQKKNFHAMAKMLTCFDNVIENAVGIEIHNRNQEGYKPDDSLNKVYVLASAFLDGKNIIPVKLEVKEFFDKKSTLHVAIALESIEIDGIVKQETTTQKNVAQQYSPPSDISITEYFQKINPSDKSFYKYIPEPFLTNKSQFSLNPTDEELMRETARRRDFNYSEGQKLKAEANENQNKVYTQRDAAAIVSSVLSEHMSFGEVYGNLHGKSRKEIGSSACY